MDIDPCKVCGGTEVNLVDGYKYCIECGTQNENFRETVIEYQTLEDGNVLFKQTKKITIQPDLTKENVDEEWLKWHTFNFILTGLIDEVISLGARSSVKTKLFWIWKRYVTKYRDKSEDKDKEDHDSITQDTDDKFKSTNTSNQTQKLPHARCKQEGGLITISVLYAMIYIALNFDHDDMQASDLIRYIREGRLSYKKCIQLIPKGLDYKKIRQWKPFLHSIKNFFTLELLRCRAFYIIKELDLGAPVTPNMIKLCDRYIKELALPKDLMSFILCLMNIIPPFNKDLTCDILRWPWYEERAMGYIVVSMKLLFGLDDVYEYRLDTMSKDVNQQKNYEKSFKFKMFFEKSQRSFIWTDWTRFITYRKLCLSKFFYPVAMQVNSQKIDAELLISQYNDNLEEYKSNMDYSSQLTLQVLQKLSNKNSTFTVPNLSFPPSLTPMSSYTDVLINSKWMALKLNEEIISEDFCSYSLNHIFGEALSKGRPLENKVIAEKGLVKDHLFGGIKIDKTDIIVNFNKDTNVNDMINQGAVDAKESTSDTLKSSDTLHETLVVNLRDETELASFHNDNDDCLSMRSDVSHSKIMKAIPLEPTLNSELARDEAIRSILEAYSVKYHLRKTQPRKRTKDELVICDPNFKRKRKTPNVKSKESAVTRQNVDNILSSYFNGLQNLASNSYGSWDRGNNLPHNDKENQNAANINMPENLDACDAIEINAENEIYNEPLNQSTQLMDIQTNDISNSANNKVEDNLDNETKDEIDEMDVYMDSSDEDIPLINFGRFNFSKITLTESLPSETRDVKALKIDSKDNLNETLNESVNEYSLNKTGFDESGVRQDNDEGSNCSADIPLNVIFQNILSTSQTPITCNNGLLTDKYDSGKPFGYWIRHYNLYYRNKMVLPSRFIKELDTCFPANFAWFVKLCASTIETTSINLYRAVIAMEESLMVHLPSLRNT